MTRILILGTANFETRASERGPSRMAASLVMALVVMATHLNAEAAQAPVDLRSTSRFAVLAGSEITSIPASAIKGDVGLSPAARSKITGLTAPEVTGAIFAADDGGAVAVMLTQAKGDLDTAYNDAAGRSLGAVNVANADLGGRTLVPGLYKSSGTLAITGTLTLDAQGDPNAVFIFQAATSLNTAPGSQIVLAGQASATNIYWQVGSSATLGTGTVFKGTILADQSVSLATGATLEGRALARIGAVTLESNAITIPRPVTDTVVLVSAAKVNGPYTNTPGYTVNLAAKTITVAISGNARFYQIMSNRAVAITRVTSSGGQVVITYN